MAKFKIMSQHILEGTGGNHEKPARIAILQNEISLCHCVVSLISARIFLAHKIPVIMNFFVNLIHQGVVNC